ncbi:zinc finger CCCH domain-containing protein 8-like [Salvelinus sp. IW2-2015]|uniref:zinc finger CCCH domain-containing protein 8-like n=1 Tax=Salvelinus sp. IW2-2015 TaxID=2691554 RepID=UPI000CEAC88A|nr:zinc finger CCCH domain-containing protein 8-like [Salvelinus alpinus]
MQMQQMKGNKNWGSGHGRGGAKQARKGMKHEGQRKGPGGFQEKHPIMTKDFINQHTVEHNRRYICKYFLEVRCIKGTSVSSNSSWLH